MCCFETARSQIGPTYIQEYFSAHGPDALLIASTVYKTTNVIRYLGSTVASGSKAQDTTNQKRGLPSLTLSTTLAKGFLRDALTSKQMRVEIWEGEHGKKQGNRWSLGKEVRVVIEHERGELPDELTHVITRPHQATFSNWKISCSHPVTMCRHRS